MDPVNFSNTELPDIIELKNVCQDYMTATGNVTIIKDLNLLIEDKPSVGQFVVLLGSSGCGKSTLLRFISGLQQPTSGEILIRGKAPKLTDPISMVFQQYSSLPWLSVLDNVCLGMKFAGVKKEEQITKGMDMLKIVGLSGQEKKFAKYPNLSGGQLQRVAIARCLLTNPSILLFDEPFSGLDTITRSKMQTLINDIWLRKAQENQDVTAVFVTHNIQEACLLGDEIWIMSTNPGAIVDRIMIDLPPNRDQSLKRTKQFIDVEAEVEDRFNKVNGK